MLLLKGRAVVETYVTVGGRQYDELIEFTRVGDRWQMPGAAEIGSDSAAAAGSPPFVVFGVRFGPRELAYVFPGTVRMTLASPFVTLTEGGTDVAASPGPSNAFGQLRYRLSTAGKAAVRTAFVARMTACATTRQATPDDASCPNSVTYVNGSEVPDSFRWTAPTDYSSLEVTDDVDGPPLDDVPVTATVRFTVTYRVRDDEGVRTVRETDRTPLYGSVDLTTSPPTYSD